ncbi:MAG: 3-phosphoshikimate 1-carboxyvinyltransferase, partial [Ilumatobacteraceae bacterium]
MNSGEARSVPVLSTGFTKRVAVPGSKSIANRALICALLADGESRVFNLPDGDDTASM